MNSTRNRLTRTNEKLSVLCFIIVATTAAAATTNFSNVVEVIKPAGEDTCVRDDYFTTYQENPCDFDIDGDFERIAGFGKGLRAKKVEKGSFSFATGKDDNYFFFGRHMFPSGSDDIPDENICFGQPRWGEYEIRMRVKQSLPSSTWTFSMRRSERDADPGTEIKVKAPALEGTDWQEMVVPFMKSRQPYRTLCISTEEPGNEVSIDHIRVNHVRRPMYFRKELVLDADPVHAEFQVGLKTGYEVYVNGVKASSSPGYYSVDVNPVVDLGGFLKKGRNVIAVGTENNNNRRYMRDIGLFCCKGLALLKNGEFVAFNSDADWKGTCEKTEEWQSLDFKEDWAPVNCVSECRMPDGPANYVGPLYIPFDGDPIFTVDSGIEFHLVLPEQYRVSFKVTDSLDAGKAIEGDLEKNGGVDGLSDLKLRYDPGKPGVWRIDLKLLGEGTNVLAERSFEAAVVGRIEQKKVSGRSFTEGMKLTRVCSIDCTSDSENGLFHTRARGGLSSEVVKRDIGKYREGEANTWCGFGYRFSVTNLYRPHLIEIEYPDDTERRMLASVFCVEDEKIIESPENCDWLREERDKKRWHTGTITGGYEFPVGNDFKKMYLIYWPNGRVDGNILTLMSETKGLSAAARSITVYEIDDIPALDIPVSPDRLFGMYVERESITPKHFYTGRYGDELLGRPDQSYGDYLGRLRDWYITCENLIKYLRFSGQNTYIPGYFMYDDILFPENSGHGPLFQICTDHLKLMASMFDANDLNLLLGMEYSATMALVDSCQPTNWEVRHEGKPTIQSVSRKGTQSAVLYAVIADFQNPTVLTDIKECLDVFLDYAREFKCVRGVVFLTRNAHFPCVSGDWSSPGLDSSMDWGWQDSAVEAFEKETGIVLPVDKNDPDRFERRHAYVMSNPDVWSKWIDFRCGNVSRSVATLKDHVCAQRPDWRLYTCQVFPTPHERDLLKNGTLQYGEAMRHRGFLRELYVSGDRVVNLPEAGRDGRGMFDYDPEPSGDGLWNYWQETDGVYFTRWFSAHTFDVVAAEPYTTWAYAQALANSTPGIIVYSQADNQPTSGGEQRFRAFLEAYRSIPAGKYETLRGKGRDRDIVIRASKGEQAAVYIINPFRFPVRTKLVLSGASSMVDAVTGEKTSNALDLDLKPYEIRVFKGPGEVASAETRAGPEAVAFVKQRKELLRRLMDLPQPTATRLVCEWVPGASCAWVMQRVHAVDAACAAGDYLDALRLVDHREMRRLCDSLARYSETGGSIKPAATYRVVCGLREPYTDSEGREWMPEQEYMYGATAHGYVEPETAKKSGSVYRKNLEVVGTSEQDMYRSERFNVAGYRFYVPNGVYGVRLHFAEGYAKAKNPNKRVNFDIFMEGKQVEKGLCIIEEAGGFGKALVKTYDDIVVSDNELEIRFEEPFDAKIMAIEVFSEE